MDDADEVSARQNRQEAPPSKGSRDPDGRDVPRDYKYKYKYKYEKGQDEDKDEADKNKDDEKDEDGGKGDKKDKDGDDGQKKPRNRTPIIILVVIAVIAIIGGLIFWLMTRNQESTDDAYTEGNAVSIAPLKNGVSIAFSIPTLNSINVRGFRSAGRLAGRKSATVSIFSSNCESIGAVLDRLGNSSQHLLNSSRKENRYRPRSCQSSSARHQ